jgi:hypothetical protein
MTKQTMTFEEASKIGAAVLADKSAALLWNALRGRVIAEGPESIQSPALLAILAGRMGGKRPAARFLAAIIATVH